MRALVLGPMGMPPKVISPELGLAMPAISFISVVLPLPLGPSSRQVSPPRSCVHTSFRAVTPR